jgi:hypothetical protein
MERFNLKKLNEADAKETEVSNRFVPLVGLDVEVEINSTSETFRENITITAMESLGHYELKKCTQWFNKGCSKLLLQRKRAKLQWVQDPSEINWDNLNNVKHEASRYFRNRKREYLKEEINEFAKNSNKNIRDLNGGINEFSWGYQRRNNLVKDRNADLLADSHNISTGERNTFLSY